MCVIQFESKELGQGREHNFSWMKKDKSERKVRKNYQVNKLICHGKYGVILFIVDAWFLEKKIHGSEAKMPREITWKKDKLDAKRSKMRSTGDGVGEGALIDRNGVVEGALIDRRHSCRRRRSCRSVKIGFSYFTLQMRGVGEIRAVQKKGENGDDGLLD
ncbi:hypothetical protein R6Q59_027288 [Mikania micrantha]